jgi:hypothetical protein
MRRHSAAIGKTMPTKIMHAHTLK